MPVRVTFKADPRLKTHLGELAALMVGRLALQVETAAKRNAPVKTGNLRRSITSFVAEENGVPTGIVTATAHYAGFVELGTVHMAPRPFLRRALIDTIGGTVRGI